MLKIQMRTLAETADQIRRRETSPVDVAEECLDTIASLNPILNAFITVTEDSSLREAANAENETSAGNSGGATPGTPIALRPN